MSICIVFNCNKVTFGKKKKKSFLSLRRKQGKCYLVEENHAIPDH